MDASGSCFSLVLVETSEACLLSEVSGPSLSSDSVSVVTDSPNELRLLRNPTVVSLSDSKDNRSAFFVVDMSSRKEEDQVRGTLVQRCTGAQMEE